ncbi:40S ribosomal protein [Yarrowia sp. B02]|nr:40S ribosomal protein [Yarrowia sp. B02]
MGISRDSRHKRSHTGAKRVSIHKKRKFECGRQGAVTRIGPKRIHTVRTRGGNKKFRAIRIETGNFSWGSEGTTRKTRVLGVSFHPSNNELIRTNTLTKSAIVQIDATPFRQWYESYYGKTLGKKKAGQEEPVIAEADQAAVAARQADAKLDPAVEAQFGAGRLYACVSSRPGQSGRVDGYVLEGEELAFYLKKIVSKK